MRTRLVSTLRWLPALGLAALLGSDAAVATPDNGACCVQSTSRLDARVNPTRGSDERFFTSAGGPPNVLLILDTSGSMNDWPQAWPTSKGCNSHNSASNPNLHPNLRGYEKTKQYPGLYTGFTSQTVPKEHPDWFNRTKFYSVPSSNYGTNFSSSGAPSGTTYATALAACTITGISAADKTTCQQCLADDGYYVYNATTKRASGNFLNYYGPRDFGAVSALSHIIFEVREVRMAVMTLTKYGSGATRCFANAGSGSACGCLFEEFGPSCAKSYPLDMSSVENQRHSILGALSTNGTWSGCGTPLADLMYAGAHYFRSLSPFDGFTARGLTSYPTDADFNESTTNKSICSSCGFNAVILITDGEPNDENIAIPAAMTTPAIGAPQCTGAYCGSKVDEMARWLWSGDLRAEPTYPGVQKVATYTVGLAVNADTTKLLQSVATAGGGKYYPASRSSELQDVVMSILDDIASRNTSFSAASVASVQTGTATLSAVLPRMLPKKGQPWEGRLWRFEQFNEFVEGVDKNGDGDLADIFVIDTSPVAPTSPDNIVIEDADGNFIRKSDSQPAQPHWEANAKLVSALSGAGDFNTKRNLWTVLDTNNDGAFTQADTLTRFQVGTATEDLKLGEYLGILGTDFCPTLGSASGQLVNKLGLTVGALATLVGAPLPATPSQADYDRACVRGLIRYVQGMDLLDTDGDGNRAEPRASVLGDIFHSSPLMVEPPVDPFLCNLGLANQCVRTLFSETLGVAHTPLATTTVTTCATPVNHTVSAYQAWAYAQAERDKVILVGANDGMVHAFEDSRVVTAGACTGSVPSPTWAPAATSGRELWAFISPDQLPRLQELVLGHAYTTDGDIMVRDIWADDATSPDGIKQASEFHTLAVVSEGRGGTHYFALELLYDASGAASDRPGFRWLFPQPCSEESATFGKSFYALSPKPPPIGPVLIEKTSLPAANPLSLSPAYARYDDAETHERWVVALSGGWSPGLERGRGVYLVDAWEGALNGRRDNLWWKAEFDPTASGDETAPLAAMTHSVPAPVALVDYGGNGEPRQDGFFDTAVWGDTAGQVWLARLHAPGRYDATTGRIGNWSAARAFEADRDQAPSVRNKNPFFYLPSVAIEPGTNKLRVFLGSGNRYGLLEEGAGMCRFDNPAACSRAGCTDVNVRYQVSSQALDATEQVRWGARTLTTAASSQTSQSDSMCGAAGGVAVTASFLDYSVAGCALTGSPATTITPGNLHPESYQCGLNLAGTSFTCRPTAAVISNTEDLLPADRMNTTGLGKNRFYGFWAYGAGRAFAESPDGGTTPAVYDSWRLTDRTTAAPAAGDLINVTTVGCTAGGVCDGGASATDYGWVMDYDQLATKTATGSAVLASCVLWSNLSPSGGDGGACAAGPQPLSRLLQGDFITGQPNCAAGFLPGDGGAYARALERTVVAPPPEPAAVIQVSRSGQIKYSAMLVEPGKGQATTADISTGQDVLQQIYELVVPHSLHDCRHADGGCIVVP